MAQTRRQRRGASKCVSKVFTKADKLWCKFTSTETGFSNVKWIYCLSIVIRLGRCENIVIIMSRSVDNRNLPGFGDAKSLAFGISKPVSCRASTTKRSLFLAKRDIRLLNDVALAILLRFAIDELPPNVDLRAAVFMNGKSANIAHAYNCEKIVVFDFARCMQEFVNYSIIEAIKNGLIFSPKYESKSLQFKEPAVIVFANDVPCLKQLSEDRWNLMTIENEQLIKLHTAKGALSCEFDDSLVCPCRRKMDKQTLVFTKADKLWCKFTNTETGFSNVKWIYCLSIVIRLGRCENIVIIMSRSVDNRNLPGFGDAKSLAFGISKPVSCRASTTKRSLLPGKTRYTSLE
ncbi:MREP-like protein [Mya arenaria]|uniref:MREP-like protein n=1 Tax=Mya arenaria TaxID=6604 RepID=A0ABY7FZ65_MYAAR|nr:MREP-like protein [Mya arenaria]